MKLATSINYHTLHTFDKVLFLSVLGVWLRHDSAWLTPIILRNVKFSVIQELFVNWLRFHKPEFVNFIVSSLLRCPRFPQRSSYSRTVHVGVQSVTGDPRNVLSVHSCPRSVRVGVQIVTGDPRSVLSIYSYPRSVHVGVQSLTGDPRIVQSIHICPKSVHIDVQIVTVFPRSVLKLHSCPRSVCVGVHSRPIDPKFVHATSVVIR